MSFSTLLRPIDMRTWQLNALTSLWFLKNGNFSLWFKRNASTRLGDLGLFRVLLERLAWLSVAVDTRLINIANWRSQK